MVGYGHLDGTKAYRIYIPSQHRVILSRDVIFMEPSAPPSDDSRDPPSSSPPTSSSLPPPTHPSSLDPISPPSPSPTIPSSTNPHPQSPNLPAPATSSPPPLFSNLPLPSTPQDFHLPSFSPPSSPPPPHCTTRSSPPSPSALPDPSLFSFLKVLPSPSEPIDFTLPPLSNTSANAALHHHYEPQTIHEARTGPDAAEWIKAADAELAALHANDTYSIVPRPPKCKPIPCKWIFKVKENADGTSLRGGVVEARMSQWVPLVLSTPCSELPKPSVHSPLFLFILCPIPVSLPFPFSASFPPLPPVRSRPLPPVRSSPLSAPFPPVCSRPSTSPCPPPLFPCPPSPHLYIRPFEWSTSSQQWQLKSFPSPRQAVRPSPPSSSA
ncbi:unnamed protein product [Closterium sp. NIES-65]|nr:unnamed protein product [Closterium sp. NIES-65]